MTDCQRLLAVLSDGKPHDHRELYALGMIVHSRIADLRSNGHNIVCEAGPRRNGRTTYFYRLATLRESSQSSTHLEVAHDGDDPQQIARDAGRGDSRSAADAGAVPPSPLTAPALQLALELPHRWEPAA